MYASGTNASQIRQSTPSLFVEVLVERRVENSNPEGTIAPSCSDSALLSTTNSLDNVRMSLPGFKVRGRSASLGSSVAFRSARFNFLFDETCDLYVQIRLDHEHLKQTAQPNPRQRINSSSFEL